MELTAAGFGLAVDDLVIAHLVKALLARSAVPVVPTVPASTNTLSQLEVLDAVAYSRDSADDLVAGHDWAVCGNVRSA